MKNIIKNHRPYHNKKSQGLTLNTVVIAVLVLVVLGILLFIAYKYIYGAGESIGALSKCGGTGDGAFCVNEKYNCQGSKFYNMGGCGKGEKKTYPYCCIPKAK